MKILNYGSLNIDLVYSVQQFVRAGETIASKGFQRFSGGKGLNQSVALGRAQADVFHGGKVGSDGLFLIDMLQEANVDTRHLKQNGSATGTAVIQVDRNGQNCIIIHGGANQENTREEIDQMVAAFSKGDMLLLQNEVNHTLYAIEAAKAKGMLVTLNPSPISDELKTIPPAFVDIWILNEVEGFELTRQNDPDQILTSLHKQYPFAQIVLTLGSKGCICFNKGRIYRQAAFPVQSVDTTAAGDTFTGFYLACIAKGNSVADALRFASKASSIAVTRPGAAPSIPTYDEVDKALRA